MLEQSQFVGKRLISQIGERKADPMMSPQRLKEPIKLGGELLERFMPEKDPSNEVGA